MAHDMDSWPGCRTVTGLDVPKPHLRLVTNEDLLPGKPPHVTLVEPEHGSDEEKLEVGLVFVLGFATIGMLFTVVGLVALGFRVIRGLLLTEGPR